MAFSKPGFIFALPSSRSVCAHTPLPSPPIFLRARFRLPLQPKYRQSFSTRSRRFQDASSQSATPSPTVIVQRPRRSLRPYIYAAAFLLLGLGAGQFVRAVIVPPPLPLPDTAEDHILLSKLRKDIDALPIVQELRARRDAWLEFDAYMDQAEAQRIHCMTAGSMSGSRGLGLQRIFWNKAEQRLLAVVFLGGGITGWPGVTHGGAVATILQENLERVANGPEVYPKDEQGNHILDKVEVNYRKPTQANRIYVVRAEVDSEGEVKWEAGGLLADHLCVKATIEDAWTGVRKADATGRCTVGPVKLVKEEAQSLWSKASKMLLG
jgi:hypothetical protein